MQDCITPHGTTSVQFQTGELLTSGVFQSAFSDHGGGVTETSEGKVEITEADVPDLQKEPHPDQELCEASLLPCTPPLNGYRLQLYTCGGQRTTWGMLTLSTTWVQGTNCQSLGLAAPTITVQDILLAQPFF